MKKILCILSMCATIISYAQDDFEMKTLASKDGGKTHISGWGGFSSGYQSLDKKAAYGGFAAGAVLINHRLSLGFGGGWAITQAKANESLSKSMDFFTSGGYGGFFMGYDVKPAEPIHMTFSLLLGAGAVSYHEVNEQNKDYEYNYYDTKSNQQDYSASFVARPALGVDCNIAKWFKLGLEAAYIYSASNAVSINKYNVDETVIEPIEVIGKNGLSGYYVGLTFKFGAF